MGGLCARQDALSTGEPAEEFADEDGLFPAAIGESFGVDFAETDFVCPAVDADTACACEDGIVDVGGGDGVVCVSVDTATKDVALEDAEEDEHGA